MTIFAADRAGATCRPMKRTFWTTGCVALASAVFACGGESAPTAGENAAAGTEDELVATFDQEGNIDLARRTRVLLVGDSDKLAASPLHAATTKARRYAELYPNDQIVLFTTQDVSEAELTRAGAELVENEPFGTVRVTDLTRLSTANLVAALDRFAKIASLDFYGHSSPFGLLLESKPGEGRVVDPAAVGVLKNNFERAANPYVTLNGCNAGVSTAADLSRAWGVPVSGAMTASNFQELRTDGRFYRNDPASYPAGLKAASRNEVSYGDAAPSCSNGACTRMRPDNYPYYGVWAPEAGMQYGLNYYKFFCDFADRDVCTKGMAASLHGQVSDHPVDASSSDAEVREALADYFCTREQDPAWFEQCKAGLFDSVDNGTAFSPMKIQNDYSLECDFKRCEQEFRCKMQGGVPEKHTCTWLSANCPSNISSPKECRAKNTKKRTTANEFAAYLEGHHKLAR